MSPSPSTCRGDAVRNPLFARFYTRMVARESAEGREHRRKLLAGLDGGVIELGAGTGTNFALYPPEVSRVVAIEPEPYMRAQAQRAAAACTTHVEVLYGTGDALPVDDESFDAAVASLVLCSVPDQVRTLGELRRALRSGGELRFYEHVLARHQPLRGFLIAAEKTTIWPRLAGGCHPARETADAIRDAGFDIEQCERFGFAAGRFAPRIPHILGVARRP